MDARSCTVSELNRYIKSLFETDPRLYRVAVRGELSNFKRYPSGHCYFTLKDELGAIRCVIFQRDAAKLRFLPENGMKVICTGRVSVFERDGAYQLYTSSITPDGIGELYAAYEQLKARLASEGLFDPAHKKPLPEYPERIAVITSGAGAAVRDIIRILGCRWPLSKVIVLPVRVQGAEAPAEIAGAIRYANRWKVADLIITGRGGGSLEDLWAFNDERVVRAIYESELPVISAVGHEPDVTLSDFVADVRASTPSNAAELAVRDRAELCQSLDRTYRSMSTAMEKKLCISTDTLKKLSERGVLQSPLAPIRTKQQLLDRYSERLLHAETLILEKKQSEYRNLLAKLDALSPLRVLQRGYSIVSNAQGAVITDAEEVSPGEDLQIRLLHGELSCIVEGKGEKHP